MFGGSRRHRQASQPLTAATANPNAATAAASAFARRASSSSLSSAAAAAALRARPTTPINVAEVQTKRTQKRSTSVSSHGSQDTRKGLQRSPSQSSMTERTFRSPSPHRTPAASEDAPPVPVIPDDVRSNRGNSTHTKATKLQMQPFRVASQKAKEGAGSWFGAATEGNMANVRTSDAPMRATSPEFSPGAVSPTSSINFSYPRGLHSASPPASPTFESMRMTSSQRHAPTRRTESVNSRSTTSDQSLVYDPNSRRMVPKVTLLVKEQTVRDASEKSAQKKKHQQQGLARSGSHLAKGTVSRVHGAAVDAERPASDRQEQSQVYVSSSAPEQKSLQNHIPIRETSLSAPVSPHVEEHQPNDRKVSPPHTSTVETHVHQPAVSNAGVSLRESISNPEPQPPVVQDVRKSDGATILPHSEPRQGAPILGRKPSIVREESDEDLEDSEDEEARRPAAQYDVAHVADAAPVVSSTPPKQPSLSSESTAVESPVFSSQRHQSPPEQRQHGSVRNDRAHSSSPARSARFALGTDQLVVRHEPPPRSVSPRKSAMKHSTSPSRGASPTDESSEASGPSRYGNEATATEPPMARKKSVRVSFDDENTKAVGQVTPKPELDLSIPPSPQQTKRHWYSHLGRNRKKDIIALDDDEVMKPRPALPSFGSIREKKPRDTEERPLVRPLEPPSSPSVPEASADPDAEGQSVLVGQSTDHNVGAILNQEQTARNAANISRFREPLPPVVTSIEGNGYYSASSTGSEDEEEQEIVQEPEPTLPPKQVKEEILAAHPELVDDGIVTAAQAGPAHQNNVEDRCANDEVPSISVIQPTPTPKESAVTSQSGSSGPGYFDVPGGFPEDSEDNEPRPQNHPEAHNDQKFHTDHATIPKVDRVVAFAPSAQKTTYQPLVEDSESSEGDSIYSDAYEDLSEVEGDGFMSLDAIVTTPIPDKVSQKLFEKALTTPPQEMPEDHQAHVTHKGPGSLQIVNTSRPEDEWEKAKEYWRGLTSDKRKQLEKEVQEEAGADGDLEEVVQPKKMKRKKSVRRNEPSGQQQTLSESERVYQIQPGARAVDEVDELPSTLRQTLRGRQQHDAPRNVKLQKTMRGAQNQPVVAAGTGMRKTLRPENSAATSQNFEQSQHTNSGRMRMSMRQPATSRNDIPRERSDDTGYDRPLSLQGPPASRETEGRRNRHASMDASMSSTELARAMQANLRRRASDSSESSFKRARPSREGFGFRKSMRSNIMPDSPMAGRNSRFSLRSASPPGSPSSPPLSMGTRMTMRTLRSDSSDGSARRMRLPSFGKSSSKKTVGKSGNKSRFGDSSDEDDAGPSTFRSRFANSSDEEEAPASPPVHSMSKSMRTPSSAAAAAMKVPPPRYEEKGEVSPDLPDSSDEEAAPAQQQKRMSPRKVSSASGRLVKSQSDSHGLQRSGSGRGALMDSATTPSMGTQVMSRPAQERRGSFLSVLRRKKDNSVGKISRPTHGESAARMDTKLERSADEISALRSNNMSSVLQNQPAKNWPLAGETVDDEKRPMTAGNSKPMDESRPVYTQRRSTNQGLASYRPAELDETQVEGPGKKKKKFGTLRRMFKLDD
ncbi:uncharacterized protein CTRU02_207327 [Colletotrichum truncatum]|uniref:Uncharacterized protein n=1 Tax=Colletotrichum truncatum TaxID=5467 RepID=A0ACC3Z0I7_COLTU|nr:uncharacterized protein CTRU02_01038 [Colletotrichum truncatum]KAF6800633.1 hypothetical protein CTRU02_01038 [Colletotrichum truncatum]